MYRVLGVVGIVVGLGLVSWAAPEAKKPPLSMIQKLNQRVDFSGIDDPRNTLSDALENLSRLYDVSFEINEQAFKMDGLMEVGRAETAQPTSIPPMKNARLDRVLHRILQRIPAPSGATYYVHNDHIEITTGTFQRVIIWGAYGGPYLPLVNLVLDKRPLEDAVRELADLSGFNIVVDARAGDKAKTPVSARFLNTPLDTALRLLTDMTELRSVHVDNVLYVTTEENAAALEARLEKEKASDKKQQPGPQGAQFGTWRKGSGCNPVVNPNADGA
jgi:hypothetical protein